ncbi:glutathionylspermidine synthase family protein [Tahibacter amnicola]|uniref:Glutathionylspermidine synthase family protein n=1 Tax=Tahibacter amnicola TaxID=2976241 RepID=A0ABY6BCR3_9GAMM|nr:glutathionylspermidine synthase family protein [Tahibacter amnicola]UXI67327.1 glutathionylspermidine synthase family protein [Tahibacter amnicola]
MQRIAIAERPDWRETAASLGFRFHTIEGEPYWDESAYYAFTLPQIENDLEDPTTELHAMAMAMVDEVVGNEELLTKLAIPASYWEWIAASWRRRDPHLYGRMDLAYDGKSPAKLYELNYDTPTALYEAAFFQWVWLEQQQSRGQLGENLDQYNLIQDLLVEALGTIAPNLPKPLYFSAVRDSLEDQGTVAYLRDCAEQAGITTRSIAIEDIGLSEDGRFTDLDDYVIQSLFKLYPLEFMFAEEFGPALPHSGIQLIEPPWKSILSNKGILPLLWEKHRGHPNLLEAHFETADAGPLVDGWVRKPLFSREGANIAMRLRDGSVHESQGPYDDAPWIRQAAHPLPRFGDSYTVIGSWVIADRAAGIGIREDAGLITRDTSRFVPHVIV